MPEVLAPQAVFYKDLKTFLNAPTIIPFEIGERPADADVAQHYGIIYPVVRVPTWGTFSNGWDTAWTHVQITLVGIDPRQALWASDWTARRIIGADGGDWLYPFTFSGGKVLQRELLTGGSVVRGSENIHQCPDTYRFLLEG